MSHIGVVRTLLLSQDPDLRISPNPLDDGAVLPYITLQEIISKNTESHDGDSGLDFSTIQINCWSKDYTEADNLRTTVKGYVYSAYESPIEGVNHQGDTEFYSGLTLLHQLITRFKICFEVV